MLVGTNFLTPFSYAQVDTTEVIPENEVEVLEESLWKTEQDFSDDIVQILEDEGYENSSQFLGTDIQWSNNSEKIEEELVQVQNLNIAEMDLNNPIHLYRNWELTWTYTWLSQVINDAESGDVVKLIEDISVSETSVVSWKALTIDGDNHTITRTANIRTITVNESSSLKLIDITITDNAVNFAPNRYDSLLKAKASISLCLWWVNETRNESWDVTASACAAENLDTAKTNPQIYSVWDIYGDNLTISNSLNSNGSAAIIVEKWWIEMINSNFIHNWASGWWRGWAIRVWPNNVTNIVDESPITKILFSWCVFESNYSNAYWWALAFHYAPGIITIANCIFSGNTASANWWAIHIPNIWTNPMGSLPRLPDWSLFPVWTMYVINSDFYSNWCGNDGSAIENDDKNLEIDTSNFEHNYWMKPASDSIWVISCQAGWSNRRSGRWLIRLEFSVKNSTFKDSNTVVLWDHGRVWWYLVDNCLFENQKYVLLSYHWRWEIKNSIIKNSSSNCGKKWSTLYDIILNPDNWYMNSIIPYFGESLFKLENNEYSNSCTTNVYFNIHDINSTEWILNIEIYDEAKLMISRKYYDSVNSQWTDEVYYGATINDWKYAYIKKNKIYNFDEFNEELPKFSNWYQLTTWKTMLFYIDSGYTQLWSGSISTTTNLYWKETNIHNIAYEWMDWVDFEWITHTYKFNNLNHIQYLTELTPYALNMPSKNWYKFEWWFLDSWYTLPITTIEAWTTWDIILYAKWTKTEKKWYSWWGGGWWWATKPDTPKEEQKPADTSEQVPQNDNSASSWANVKTSEDDTQMDSQIGEQSSSEQLEWQGNGRFNTSDNSYTNEQKEAYAFAKENGITTMNTIQKADMSWKLTRIQMAKMLSQYAINVLWQTPDTSKTIKFRDVTAKRDADYDNGVTLAYQLWIMWQNMKDNKFRPNDEVSRAEFVTALSRLLYSTSDGEYKSTSRYYIHHMEKLVSEWIITVDNPKMKERRWYVMIMLMRSAK